MTSYDDVIMRTIIELPDDQVEALDVSCVREGVSRAEGVRRAVGQYLLRERVASPEAAFGLWRGRKIRRVEVSEIAPCRVGPPRVKAVFDTNILIDYLAGREDARLELTRYDSRLVSVVTWMEVMAGARSEAEEDVLRMFLRDFSVVEIQSRRGAVRGCDSA